MTEKKLTRRQEIDLEVERLAAELAPDCTVMWLNGRLIWKSVRISMIYG